MIKVTPVILCGGSGTRLWPLSRTGFPKQFLSLTGNDSLYQQAAKRLTSLVQDGIQFAAPMIVSGEEHRFIALEQLREVGISVDVALLEPIGRNTAPALTLAALAATEKDEDPVLVVTPADQTVTDLTEFSAALKQAISHADDGSIVILGVNPDKPETGYGYIHAEQNKTLATREPYLNVKAFVEKPNKTTAEKYIKEGGYYWNAGIFVLRASTWLNALQKFRPDIVQASKTAWAAKKQDSQFIRPGKEEYASIPSESIDYAVMEKCPGDIFPIRMVSLNAGWSDLGAWDAVWNISTKDGEGNAHIGDVLSTNSNNTLVHASNRMVTLVGVSNLIVIETADAVLVADKTNCQDVRQIVSQLQSTKREELTLHRKVHRPWGWYDSIDEAERFKVKRIMVNPGASLSLQKHHHRAEHWIVVKGTAEITIGDKVIFLTENQSTYIPLGEIHRLANPGHIPLEIIEIQSGSYLQEDDIVRFEDNYGR